MKNRGVGHTGEDFQDFSYL